MHVTKQIQHVLKYEREQTRAEEIANSISHGLGLVAAIVATPFIIMQAAQLRDTGYLIGVSIFAASMIVLYLGSTLYHHFSRAIFRHCTEVKCIAFGRDTDFDLRRTDATLDFVVMAFCSLSGS